MRRASSSVLGFLAALPLVACLQLPTTSDAGTSGSGSGSGSSSGATSDAGAVEGGTLGECGTDPATGVVLCLQTSACPNMTLDTSAFPECGFHQGGASAFDLECLCNGDALCPIGVPTSCDSAAQLLMQQGSALQVCQQVSTGGCVSLTVDAGSSSSSGSSSGSGEPTTACQTCVAGCGGTPACYQSCGC